MSAPGRLSAANTGDNGASYLTALKGASLAFQRTGPRQQQQHNLPVSPAGTARTTAQGLGGHEALIAATSSSSQHTTPAATGSQTHPRSANVSRNPTGTSTHARSGGSTAGTSANDHYQHEHHGHGSVTPQRQQSQNHITQALTPSHSASLLVPLGKSPASEVKSPSLIAATLAASRSNSPSPRQSQAHTPATQQQQTPRRRGRMDSVGGQSASAASSSLSLISGPDESSLPPTNTLISMFEKKDDHKDPVKRPSQHSRHNSLQTTPLATRTAPMVLSPQTPSSSRATSPVLKAGSVSPSRQASAIAWHASSPSPQKMAPPRSPTLRSPRLPPNKRKPPTPPPVRSSAFLPGQEKLLDVDKMSTQSRPAKPPTPPPVLSQTFLPSRDKAVSSEETKTETRPSKPRPLTPPPRTISRSHTVIVSPQPVRVASGSFLANEQAGKTSVVKNVPMPVPPKPKTVQTSKPAPERQQVPLPAKSSTNMIQTKARSARKMSTASTSSNDTFVSASSAPSLGPVPPRRRTRPPSSSPPRVVRPSSAVGPSRQSQWHKQQAGPRHRASDAALDSLTSAIVAGSLASARATPTITGRTPPTPPPRKRTPGLRRTLRQPPSKSDEETNDQKHKKHRIRSNKKHSHHEGSRKRWRDEITPRERKRYEGVWASNRGHLVPQSGSTGSTAQDEDSIVNVVARDIWSRSRLPFDELAEVWDLVDREGRGVLGKNEFVVGMWLIDQRLRGRKIPQKVSDSVWGSAKGFEVVVGQPSRSAKHRR